MLALGFVIRNRFATPLAKEYFIPVLVTKLVGALGFGLIYEFYYGGGDTLLFYEKGRLVWDAFQHGLGTGLKVLSLSPGEYTTDTVQFTMRTRWFMYDEEWAFLRLVGSLNILGANSYVATSFIFAFFVFLGNWKLYEAFLLLYPKLKKPLAVAAFLSPSMLFWGSGIIKDTITLGSLGFMAYAGIQLYLGKGKKLFFLLVMIIATVAILRLKGYILYTFFPSLMLWYYLRIKGSIQNVALRYLSAPLLILVAVGCGALLITNLADYTEKYTDVDAITERIQGFHWDHAVRTGGSVYTLGEIEYTPVGILKKVPPSINVTLFRPYLWEAGSLVVMVTALESLTYFLLTLLVLLKTKMLLKSNLFSNPEVLFSIVFTLLLAFVVGFVSFNFGALARFKIPLLPFFGMALILMLKSVKSQGMVADESEEMPEFQLQDEFIPWHLRDEEGEVAGPY